jgi:putative membrane protein
MRKTAILSAALLAAACDAPDGNRAGDAAGDDTALQQNDAAMAGQDDMAMAAAPVSTGTYIARAANSDMYEIQAGELAARNGQSQEVKDFGRMMVEDHTKSSQDMKAIVARANVGTEPPARLDSEHQAMIDRLKAARGEEFDREYLSQQVTAHRKALALHQGYAQGGDNTELKGFAVQVVPVIQKHYDWLEQKGHSGMGNAATAGVGTGNRSGTMEDGTPAGSASANRAPRATGSVADQ